MKRGGVALALLAALTLAAAALGANQAPTTASSQAAQAISCSNARVAVMGPFTGPAASIGQEQLKFARFAVQRFNAVNKTRYRLVESDTQLNPAQASTRSAQLKANANVLAVAGPAGSQEVTAVAKNFAGMAYVSGSATNTSLTVGSKRVKTFSRVVPNDSQQATSTARFIKDVLGARRVYIIDDQTSYSVPLANGVQRTLRAGAVTVTRDSVNQQQTDFSSLATKIPANTQVVYLPWQLAARAATLYQQLREQGKRPIMFGSDGLDASEWINTADRQYYASFAPDVRSSKAAGVQALLKMYRAKYGDFKSNFGPPMYVATQVVLQAVKKSCANGTATRAEVIGQLRKVKFNNSILGIPIGFTATGDLVGGRFFIFQIRNKKGVFVR